MSEGPTVTFAPSFNEEFPDRLLLLKFVEWPDEDDVHVAVMTAVGTWAPVDDGETFEIRPDELPLIAPDVFEAMGLDHE